MNKPLTVNQVKSLQNGAIVYLESRSPLLEGERVQIARKGNLVCFADGDKKFVAVKFLQFYGMTGNETGWRLWPQEPSMEDMFNACKGDSNVEML